MYPAYSCLTSHIRDPQVREIFRFFDRLVNFFVCLDTPQEVRLRILRRHILIIRVTGADFEGNIRGYDSRIIADRLQEDNNNPVFP